MATSVQPFNNCLGKLDSVIGVKIVRGGPSVAPRISMVYLRAFMGRVGKTNG